MTQSLMRRTRQLLRESERSLPQIFADLQIAGVQDISYYWLRKFSSGGVDDPSVNKVQVLYEHLTGESLVVR